MNKILVTGATGHLGKVVVENLLQRTDASNIAVIARDPAKLENFSQRGVDVRRGDYNDTASLVEAFRGIDKLYFVSSSDLQSRGEQQLNVVKAAKEAGVKHVFYTSFQRKDETSASPIAFIAESHIETEKALLASGMKYTILRHGLYTDMLPMYMGEKVIESGVIYQPAGEGKVAFATRSDMAEAGAILLLGNEHENKSYNIAGSELISYHDVANFLSEITGKTIAYVSPSAEEFRNTLLKSGVPEMYVNLFAGFAEAIRVGEFAAADPTLEKIVGRKPVSVKAFLAGVYAAEKVS